VDPRAGRGAGAQRSVCAGRVGATHPRALERDGAVEALRDQVLPGLVAAIVAVGEHRGSLRAAQRADVVEADDLRMASLLDLRQELRELREERPGAPCRTKLAYSAAAIRDPEGWRGFGG
jgi:hypothetical protein